MSRFHLSSLQPLFSSSSVRARLTRIQLTTAGLVLLVCSATFMTNDMINFRKSIARTMESVAGVLAKNLAPTLSFLDSTEANKILSSLEAETLILSASLLDQHGKPFATYGDVTQTEGTYKKEIIQDGDLLGTLLLVPNLSAMRGELQFRVLVSCAVFLIGFLFSLFLSNKLQEQLSTPIFKLASMVKQISSSANYSLRVSQADTGTEVAELSILMVEFNRMLEQIQRRDQEIHESKNLLEKKVQERTAELQQAQQVALENAHAAGMAEIATNILHNIGNIVNSIGTSTDELGRLTDQSRLQGLLQANQLLKDHMDRLGEFFTQDNRGKALPEYYIRVGQSLETDYKGLKAELSHLSKKVDLIKDVVQTQQDYAKKGLFFEDLSLVTLTEEILEMQKNTLNRHKIEVVKKYADIPLVKVQKTKYAHILLNLVKNAKEAMQATAPSQKRLVIEIGRDRNLGIIQRITDSGEGIAEANLDKIFKHGFSTKQSGHGFGLHFCANAMTEMGGHLLVHSDGPGKGASFTLVFPEPKKSWEVK